MALEPAQWISFEQYLALEAAADRKHEYDDGHLTAMAGATARHVTVTQNLVGAIRSRLRGTPCRVYSADMKLRPIRTAAYYPDLFVTCDERDRDQDLVKQYPRLVIDVLSRSTEQRDRGAKWAAYRRCATLDDYLLVSQYRPLVEVFSRAGDVWVYRTCGPGEVIHLAGVDLDLPMDEVYEDVDPSDTPEH